MTDNTEDLQTPDELPPIVVDAEEPKRRRGRKPKAETVQAESAPEAVADDDKPRRKTTRKPNASSIAQIVGIHKMISLLPGLEVFQVNEAEAQILAEAMRGIADEYGVSISGKTGATLNMLAAIAMVYGPRLMILYHQNKSKVETVPYVETPRE